MGDPRTPAAAVPAWKWQLVWLLFLATLINYMDRMTTANVSRYLKADFALNEEGYGWIEFAFGFTFAGFQFVAGYLADRVSVRWLYAVALVVWSAAGFATGLTTTIEALIACRIALAMGEAFNWPCAVVTVQRTLPPAQRSLANGIFHGGSSIGAILTPLVVLATVGAPAAVAGWAALAVGGAATGDPFAAAAATPAAFVANGTGWRGVFLGIGAVGVLWAVVWLWFVRDARAAEIDTPAAPSPGVGGFVRLSLGIAAAVGAASAACGTGWLRAGVAGQTNRVARFLAALDDPRWRMVGFVTAGGFLLWAAVAVVLARRSAGPAVAGPRADFAGFFRLFGRRHIWIAIGVGVSVNLCWHFYRVWLVRHLDVGLHFSDKALQLTTAAFFLCADLGSMTAGFATRRLAHAGVRVEAARKMVMFGTAGLCLLTIPAILTPNLWVSLPLFMLVAAGAMGGFPNYFALTQEVSPPHTAQVLGATGAASWYMVAACGPLTGMFYDKYETFTPLFMAVGCVPMCGALLGLFWRRDVAEAV